MGIRQDLATAASTVAGVTCHPYFVQSTAAGTAYVRLERIDYPNPFGGICRWAIVLLLPQDLAAAEKYIEDHVPAIRVAVENDLVITDVTPQQLNITSVGVIPCVFINGFREE